MPARFDLELVPTTCANRQRHQTARGRLCLAWLCLVALTQWSCAPAAAPVVVPEAKVAPPAGIAKEGSSVPNDLVQTTGSAQAAEGTPAQVADPANAVAAAAINGAPTSDADKSQEKPAATNSGDTTEGDGAVIAPANTGTSQAAEPASDNKVPVHPAAALQRLLVLTPGGPLVVDLAIYLNGVPLGDSMDATVNEILASLPRDGDGNLTWKLLLENSLVAQGVYGNDPLRGERDRRQAEQNFDANRNGLVEPRELLSLLGSNIAGGSRSFILESAPFFQESNAARDPVWKVLDENRDDALDAEERLAAGTRLRQYDQDADEILTLSDFQDPTTAMILPVPRPRRNRRGTSAVMRLSEFSKRKEVLTQALADVYPALAGQSASEVFSLVPELLTEWDQDGDSALRGDELDPLHTCPPHAVLEYRLGNRARSWLEDAAVAIRNAIYKQPVPPSAQLKLSFLAPSLRAHRSKFKEKSGYVLMMFPGFELEWFVNDSLGSQDLAQVSRARLRQLDTNQDGYLVETELNPNVGFDLQPFSAIDANSDGMVFATELAKFLRKRQALLLTQVRVQAGERDGLLFNRLDTSRDGKLSERECQQVAERLLASDGNQDGVLHPEELLGGYAVVLARGDGDDPSLFSRPTQVFEPTAASRQDLPPWFVAQDLDGDGELSPREFLGSPQQLEQWDVSRDGYLTWDEASKLQPVASAAPAAPGEVPSAHLDQASNPGANDNPVEAGPLEASSNLSGAPLAADSQAGLSADPATPSAEATDKTAGPR